MRDASICGLGQAAPNPIDCVVKYFAARGDMTARDTITFKLDGRDVSAIAGEPII